jgi:hypothetical protein
LEGQSCLLSGGAPDSPVHHRTATVHVRCAISFHSWRSRPLQLRWLAHRTLSDAPNRPLKWATRRSRIWRPTVALAAVGSPDSPVNYSRTLPKFSRERPVRRKLVWHTGYCPVHLDEQQLVVHSQLFSNPFSSVSITYIQYISTQINVLSLRNIPSC